MKTEDFNFYLPDNLIAQTPLLDRSSSKLLILDRESGKIKHESFFNIVNYLNRGDVLVLNDTRVMPARLTGVKKETNAVVEILILKELEDKQIECLVKPAKRVKEGTVINFGEKLKAICITKKEDGICIFKLEYSGILYEILDELGEMPLPPYITEKLNNQERYQTVYSKNVGSSAAPTAGLHFTKELLDEVRKKGVEIAYVTLHVGLGTFRPVSVDNIKEHKMHSEYYELDSVNAEILNKAKKENKNIIAVGTTTTRTLESIVNLYGNFKECSGFTDIFIYPGYEFKAITSLITNFHLPKSTLIMLVSAFAGKDKVLSAYKEAVENEYRFFSFGDSMFIK